MSFWNISANAEAALVNGLPSGVNNDDGTVRHAGNIASSRFSNLTMGEGSSFVTIVSGAAGITGANPAGAFNAGDQVIRRVTTDIAGVSNNALLFGASDSSNKMHSIKQMDVLKTRYYKTAIRNNKWNEYSGAWDSGYPEVGNTGAWDISLNGDTAGSLIASGTDDAANPTQAVPGELVYHHGSGGQPTTDEYESRNLW